LDKNRNIFKGLNYNQFLNKMNTTDLYFNLFQNYLANKGVLLNISKNKSLAKRYLTAEFAKQLFEEQKYYEIILKEDAMVKAVLDRK